MHIMELTPQQFDAYVKTHPLTNYYQTTKYALFMSNYGYSYDYIGYGEDENSLVAASLILTKRMTGKTKYGYAPRGFLINYYDQNLLRNFLSDLRKYYKKRDFIFIKFNPEIIIGDTSKRNHYVSSYNGNVRIIDDLKSMNVKRRMELEEFNLLLPKFNAYIDLHTFDYHRLNRNYRKKIRNASNKGMSLTIGDSKQVEILYDFIKNKTTKSLNHFRNLYNTFSKEGMVDLVLIKIDFEKYLTNVKQQYEKESVINEEWNNLIQTNIKPSTLNSKMNSDKKLQAFKENVVRATEGLKKHKEDYVAAALIIKNNNRISIVASGFKDEYRAINPNHFLYYSIFERYKKNYNFCDLGGVSGKFDNQSKYAGLNEFKAKWNSTIYEYIGEFDLICSERVFKRLIKTSFVENEFNSIKY